MKDFRDDEEVTSKYYEEVRAMVKAASGADRVFIFDHTVRSTAVTNLNATTKGATAGAVPRVHCDYTADGAPRRLMQVRACLTCSRISHSHVAPAAVLYLTSPFSFRRNSWERKASIPS